jgi:hypothetical protein
MAVIETSCVEVTENAGVICGSEGIGSGTWFGDRIAAQIWIVTKAQCYRVSKT